MKCKQCEFCVYDDTIREFVCSVDGPDLEMPVLLLPDAEVDCNKFKHRKDEPVEESMTLDEAIQEFEAAADYAFCVTKNKLSYQKNLQIAEYLKELKKYKENRTDERKHFEDILNRVDVDNDNGEVHKALDTIKGML